MKPCLFNSLIMAPSSDPIGNCVRRRSVKVISSSLKTRGRLRPSAGIRGYGQRMQPLLTLNLCRQCCRVRTGSLRCQCAANGPSFNRLPNGDIQAHMAIGATAGMSWEADVKCGNKSVCGHQWNLMRSWCQRRLQWTKVSKAKEQSYGTLRALLTLLSSAACCTITLMASAQN